MAQTTSASGSLWLDTASLANYPALTADLEVDVAIVGGGVAGLSAAVMLCRAGARVAVLEANRVGTGVTGCSTAKVSALQATMYSAIRGRHGEAAASVYAEASVAGVERLAELVGEESIDCDLERRPAYTYAAQASDRAKIKEETEVAARAGLQVEMVDGFDVPFPVYGAVRLADQVQIHPVRYVQGLASAIASAGSHVFEHTRVRGVQEGNPCRVQTDRGEVRAEHVIVASHFPFLDRGLYFTRLKPERSYCVAAQLGSGSPPAGMSISAGATTRSIRGYGDTLIVGGEGHPTGSSQATPERFTRLEQFARKYWDVATISHRWSAQDPSHYDGLPVIGQYRPGSTRLWVASGFMKWGFASATFAALILTDRISGRPNPWADLFSPTRLSARSLPEAAKLAGVYTVDMVGDRIRPAQAPSTEQIPHGQARVVAAGLGRIGIYRDDGGELHAVSLRCTHRACLLRFNAAEHSWDCPCHGSRFDVDGTVLEGPATQPLERPEM